MTRKGSFSPGEFYHIYNRGTEKRDVFISDADSDRFLSLMYLCNSSIAVDLKLQGSTLYEIHQVKRGETLVDICLYCLMPNHFHMAIREKSDGGISRFMQKLITGYTMYFNKKYERTGALFQGKFKAKHADRDEYLKYLASYIHLNPLKCIDSKWKENGIRELEKAKNYLNDYRYSSYLDYSGTARIESILIDKNSFPEYLDTKDTFEAHINDWLIYDKQGSTL